MVLSIIICLIALLWVAHAMPPMSITANVRGKRYDVEAETVEDVCNAVEDACGLDAEQQSILFRGKLLSRESSLEDVGVSPGDTVNVVKGRRQRTAPTPAANLDVDDSFTSDSGGAMGIPSMGGGMGDMLGGGMGGMTENDMKKAMENINPEDMQKAMKAMDEILDSDFVDEYFADEERLENARLQMLNNLDQYDQMMPGFKEQAAEIASSPEKWREAMQQAREQITNLKAQRDAMRGSGGGGDFPGIGGIGLPPRPDSGVDDFDEE
jgi:hypothetical protein